MSDKVVLSAETFKVQISETATSVVVSSDTPKIQIIEGDSTSLQLALENYVVRIVDDGTSILVESNVTDTVQVETLMPGPQGEPGAVSDTAKRLTITRKLTSTTSPMKFVKADSPTHVSVGQSNTVFGDAQIVGLTLNAGDAGDDVEILVMGVVEDPVFSGMNINEPLFLTTNGSSSQVPPNAGFSKEVGYHLGGNQIFVSLKPTIILA